MNREPKQRDQYIYCIYIYMMLVLVPTISVFVKSKEPRKKQSNCPI